MKKEYTIYDDNCFSISGSSTIWKEIATELEDKLSAASLQYATYHNQYNLLTKFKS